MTPGMLLDTNSMARKLSMAGYVGIQNAALSPVSTRSMRFDSYYRVTLRALPRGCAILGIPSKAVISKRRHLALAQ